MKPPKSKIVKEQNTSQKKLQDFSFITPQKVEEVTTYLQDRYSNDLFPIILSDDQNIFYSITFE